MTYALSAVSAVRASAKREAIAARLATKHDVKGSIQVPVTIVEELLAQVGKDLEVAGGDNAAPAGEALEDAGDSAIQVGEDPEGAEVDGTAQSVENTAPEQPEQPEQPVQGAMTGTVARFMPDKGFGVIIPDDGSEDIFIHINQCNGAESLSEGDAVTYDSEWNDRKGKLQGNNCTVGPSSAAETASPEWDARGDS